LQVSDAAGSLTVVGERWTILILHEALLGTTRFADFKPISVSHQTCSPTG
jgi:DNA-binding HxlR family transcriptional regulator